MAMIRNLRRDPVPLRNAQRRVNASDIPAPRALVSAPGGEVELYVLEEAFDFVAEGFPHEGVFVHDSAAGAVGLFSAAVFVVGDAAYGPEGDVVGVEVEVAEAVEFGFAYAVLGV